MKALNSILYSIISAAAEIQSFLFGPSFEMWGYRILNSITSVTSISALMISFKFLKLGLFFSISIGLIPFLFLVLFYLKDNEEKLQIEQQRFKQSRSFKRITYITFILLTYLMVPISLLCYLMIS